MAIDASALASVLGVETEFEDLSGGQTFKLPQRIALIAQGNSAATYATTKQQITSAPQAGALYGYGSPIHLAAAQLFPANGDGVGTIPVTVYPMVDDGGGVVAEGDITPTGSPTEDGFITVRINNRSTAPIALATSATVADMCTLIADAINAVLDVPVIATDGTTVVDLDAKWDGATGNDITINVDGTVAGVTFPITAMASGASNPDIQAELDKFGNVWETLVLNGNGDADTTSLDALSTTNEGRWGATVRRPYMAFTGNVGTVVATVGTVPDGRKTDRTNVVCNTPASDDHPIEVAARHVARIAKVANNNPPVAYGGQRLTGLTPGADADQWDFTKRDQALKLGVSSTEVRDGIIRIKDMVTYYHPTGEPNPGYRYVVDVVKLQNVIFNLDLIFAAQEWESAPLIPDNQPTRNPDARKPKSAVAAVRVMHDNLGLDAIISDPEFAKENTTASIDSGNPKRLNLTTKVKLSGNTKIKDVTLKFGFFFGTQEVVA